MYSLHMYTHTQTHTHIYHTSFKTTLLIFCVVLSTYSRSSLRLGMTAMASL